MAIGDDFLTNPTSELYQDKVSTGRPLPSGLTDQNVSKAENWNAVKNALNALRALILAPFEAKGVPPENVLPNAAWQLMTISLDGPKWKADGTGEEDVISVTAYTTNSNIAVCSTSDTKNLKVGDLVKWNAPAHANLLITTTSVTAVVPNVSFSVGLPFGLTAVSSAICTCQPWAPGGTASGPTGDAADGWKKTVGAYVWREDNAANLKAGCRYAQGVRKAVGSREDLYVEVPADEVKRYAGKHLVFAAWVKQGIKGGSGTWRAWINVDGNETLSSSATTQSYQWAEVDMEIPTTATAIYIGIAFEGNAGDVYYVSQPIAGLGDYIGEGNWWKRKDEYWIPLTQFNLLHWIGATITTPNELGGSNNYAAYGGGVGDRFGFLLRMHAESKGKIGLGVRYLNMQMEGKSANVFYTRTNALKKLRLQVQASGSRGTASFKVSANGGGTFSTVQVSSSGTHLLQWPDTTYSGDANNNDVKYQVFHLGNGGTYTAGDYWDIDTDGTITFVGVGYDGVTVQLIEQPCAMGFSTKETAPTVYSWILFAQGEEQMNSIAAITAIDENAEVFLFAGCLLTEFKSVSIDINGFGL